MATGRGSVGGGRSGGGQSGGGRTFVQAILYWGTVLTIWAIIFVVAFIGVMAIDLPDTSSLTQNKHEPAITYLDRSGALIAMRGGSQSAPPVKIDELPNYVPLAFVAIEDRRFFTHPGFDPLGIMRAMLRNLVKKKGANLAGGSTITQQLARNLFLSANQNVKRKVQELMLAVWLEHKYTKKEILELYLNRVYFGAGATGIEAASQRYFNKDAKDLTVGEAAMMAGLMKAPNTYSPLSDQERAGHRALIVLNEMVQAKVITEEQRAEAISHPINVAKTLATAHAQYFIDWLDLDVRSKIDPKNTSDLIVETTLDLPIQTDAERAVQTIMARDAKKGVQQAAVVSVDGEGRVRAMIGGVSYADSQFNRATMAFRQAGSSFKPFVYLAAMEAGYQPSTPVVDEPYTIGTWSPQNYEKTYRGLTDLQTALAHSINTVAARLANDVGRDRVAAVAHRLGVKSNINTDPAMALGTSDVSPLEMAQAYIPFSNGGYRATVHGIIRIRTADGKVLYQYREAGDDGGRVQVIANPPLQEMNQMLRGVVQHGTGTVVQIPGYDLAGKTGTTSDFHDAWFDGYTGGFVTVVWVGRDDNTAMNKVAGASTPAAIWKTYMASALKRIQVSAIPDGPPASGVLGDVAEGALRDLLGTQADAVQASQAANDNNDTPGPATQPVPVTEDKPKKDQKSLDDIFSQAQEKHQ